MKGSGRLLMRIPFARPPKTRRQEFCRQNSELLVSWSSNLLESATDASAGLKADFSVIAEQHYDRIFRGAICVTGDRDAAEDIAQETFLLALRNYQSFNARSSVFTWLYRIMLRVYSRMRAMTGCAGASSSFACIRVPSRETAFGRSW